MGVTFGSGLLGGTIDQMPDNSVMSANAVFTPTTDHWFYWSIYGWTHAPYTYWSNTPSGWNNEFYIIFHTDRPTKDFLTDKGVVAIEAWTWTASRSTASRHPGPASRNSSPSHAPRRGTPR